MKKQKKKTWHSLKEEKCPKCGATLMRDLYGNGLVGCACGFVLEENVKNIIVKRDYND